MTKDELLDNLEYYTNAMRMTLVYNQMRHSPSIIVDYSSQIQYIQKHIDATIAALELLDEQ